MAQTSKNCAKIPYFVPSTVQAHLTHEHGLKGADISKSVSDGTLILECLSYMFPQNITVDDLKSMMRFVRIFV